MQEPQQNLAHWTAGTVPMDSDIIDRMERAVAKARERLLRATAALNQAASRTPWWAETPWLRGWQRSTKGPCATTRDIDLLVRRNNLPEITAALEKAGFVRDLRLDVVMFRDGAEGKPSEAVHLLFAGELTRPDHVLPAPQIQTVTDPADFHVITLDSLVTMKLMSNRRKDQVHVQDLIAVGLIDESWLTKLPPGLASRLKHILDTPDD